VGKELFQVFCDFDGTLARQDIGNSFLRKYGTPAWLRAEQEFLESKIGSREALVRQYRALDASPELLARFVAEEVEIDPTFIPFLQQSTLRDIPVTVLSDGLDVYIVPFMERYGLQDLPLFCNRGHWVGRHIEVSFPYYNPACTLCANCKTAHFERLRQPGRKIVYIGDGWSDRCPSRHADLLFAKGRLLDFCRSEGIPCSEFRDFNDVARALFGACLSSNAK